MTRINKRSASITVGGTEYKTDLTKAVITSAAADSDFVTFADAAAGGARAYNFEGTAPQDPATGSLWDKIWTSPGTTAAVIYKPFGNATASTSQPHYGFNVTILEPDGDFLGGEADASTTAVQAIDFSWPLDAKPTKITT